MACGCNKKATRVEYQLTTSSGETLTFSNRVEARDVQTREGGKIRPVRVPS